MHDFEIFRIGYNDAIVNSEFERQVNHVAPIWGRDLSAAVYFENVVPSYIESSALLTPGEVGCALSHLAVYKTILERGRPALILEDDIVVNQSLIEVVQKIVKETRPNFVHFGIHPNYNRSRMLMVKSVKLGCSHELFEVCPSVDLLGTFAYFITPSCAAELLKSQASVLRKADDWSRLLSAVGFPLFYCPVFEHPRERGQLAVERSKLPPLSTRVRVVEACKNALRTKYSLVRWTLLGYKRYGRLLNANPR